MPNHGLWTSREEIAFTAWATIQSQSQNFRYGQSIFCLPHRPNFSDIFDLCLHWVSVRAWNASVEMACLLVIQIEIHAVWSLIIFFFSQDLHTKLEMVCVIQFWIMLSVVMMEMIVKPLPQNALNVQEISLEFCVCTRANVYQASILLNVVIHWVHVPI